MIPRHSPLSRSQPPKRKQFLKRSTKRIRKVNPVAKAKRDKRYKSHLKSAYWKALRLRMWQERLEDIGLEYLVRRCEECYGPIEDFADMQLAHVSYARFGHELPEDVALNHKWCNSKEAALRGRRIWHRKVS